MPQAKHLIFEGEGAGWTLSPVLWLFKSLEPLSNLLSLISQTGSGERSPFFSGLWSWVLHLWLLVGPPTCGMTAWGAPRTFRPHTEPASLMSGGAWQVKATGRFQLKQAPGKCLPFSAHCCAQTTNSPSPFPCLRQPPVLSKPGPENHVE